ncbi:M14 metallopeptidase family protein [Pedobacter deserti]|uniref:M14 metallopeptidase family protein n=1 Tax=Pedobacter deserti TaxID=2817382 RepID=UPI0021090EAC|nr:M14 metallopeptidase family protein [Pedobacter sp. SYSU D00382]
MAKSILLFFASLLLGSGVLVAQVRTPDDYLGYELGSRFTSHDQLIAYFKHVAAADKEHIKLISYGTSYEGRELIAVIISSTENMSRLEEIRQQNLRLSKGRFAGKALKGQPAIMWMSYNVHGNEASTSETAAKTLYALTGGRTNEIERWLSNTVVIIDPCLNPDGRTRYLNYFNEVSGAAPNLSPLAREHNEPWPGGRSNHYYFDLNRDWAWQTQQETRHRLKLYRQWMPQVMVDFHEQNYNEPYYFAPAAEPIHVDVTPWQREFQTIAGKNNAKYFDEYGWQYFTKERFDLLYPSYGDTYALYNGGVGMTYEQGGIDAGLAVITLQGDTLTLKDRIAHHYTTGLATLETVSRHADKLVQEFKSYFEKALIAPPGIYKTYVVRGVNGGRLQKLAELLDRNGISYAYGQNTALRGLNYETGKTEQFQPGRNDLFVNLHQPAAMLANVLFEPRTEVRDSNTYDITAWSLPYVYGLPAYAVKESVKGLYPSPDTATQKTVGPPAVRPYAWVVDWNSLTHARLLIDLQAAGIKVRVAEEPFTIAGKQVAVGALLVYRAENEKNIPGLVAKIEALQRKHTIVLQAIASGYAEKGKDLGSSAYPVLRAPKIALLAGSGSTAQNVGEIWHFLERELRCHITTVNIESLDLIDIRNFNVLIVPDGLYDAGISEHLQDWIKAGGKLILIDRAADAVADWKPFQIRIREAGKENSLPGAIFKLQMDAAHPLSAGIEKCYFALKTDDKVYEPLEKGKNVGSFHSGSYVSGIASKAACQKLNSGMLFGVEKIGSGTVIYLGNNILFRSFWESGKQIFANAVFLVN